MIKRCIKVAHVVAFELIHSTAVDRIHILKKITFLMVPV